MSFYKFSFLELTFLEESLLKQAQEESQKKEDEEESEVERIAELRRKGRAKGHFQQKLCSASNFIYLKGAVPTGGNGPPPETTGLILLSLSRLFVRLSVTT